MEPLVSIAQVAVGLVILNVWLLRAGRATDYRGGEAKTMREEFRVYGLPDWSLPLIGSLKVVLAILLIAGVWIPSLTKPAAIGLGFLMLGAVVMHFKVSDPIKKALPACTVLALCLVVTLV